jgi:hypothetical protein
MPFGEGVRGINDLRIAPLTADTPGSSTDVAGIKTFSTSVTSDSDEQVGDDATIMVVQENKALDITFSSAYANPVAAGIMSGNAAVTSGTTPNRVITFSDPAAPNTSYIQITGQALGRDSNGSALRLTVLKAQLTEGPNFDMSAGDWLEPEWTFVGIGRGAPSYLYTLASYETAVALT